MQSDIYEVDTMSKIKNIIVRMAFKHQKTIDYCTWAFLKTNKIMDSSAPITDGKIYEVLSNENHADRIITHNNGPLLCFKEHSKPTVAKIINLIFTNQAQCRKNVYEHFIKMRPGYEIGHNTLNKLRQIEGKLLSNNWIQAAISFCDIVNIDWLCNLMGLQQANEINDENGIQDFATNVIRPSIVSAESIGVGVLQPSHAKDDYIQDFSQIYEEASDLNSLLDKYFHKYGHVPLCYDYSLYSMLDAFFAKNSYNNQQRWDSLWEWADIQKSPLPRYHACCYFVRDSGNIPKDQHQTLFNELLNIIHMSAKNNSELQWTSAWKLRCELASHFGQFLENRLPGANTERIYSQAWWMAEKVASIYDNNIDDITNVRKYTIVSEEHLSNMIWQTTRPRTQSSSLRYATLMTSSLWAISIISQIDDRFLEYICKADLLNKELFEQSVAGFLVGCFPLKAIDQTDSVYAYDVTCLNTAEYLSKNHPDVKTKEQLLAFLSTVKRFSNTNELITQINEIPKKHHQGDQLITAVAMRVMAYTDLMEDDNIIWENICNENWLTEVFCKVNNEYVVDSVIVSLIEIMLQKQDKWAWQLPHLFSIVCQNNIENEKIKKIAFACVVISSICSDTCSALKRTILNNKTELSKLQKEWSNNLQEIYHVAPEGTKSRLRPAILCLNL